MLLVMLGVAINTTNAQGKFAGSLKGFIGKSYATTKEIKALQGWAFREGNVITSVDDPETITVDVFKKGSTWMAFFSYMKDTASRVFVISDVIEVKNVAKGWEVKTAFCRQNKIENVDIVALVKSSPAEFMTTVKQAWRYNRDKKRVESLAIKGIDCVNVGLD